MLPRWERLKRNFGIAFPAERLFNTRLCIQRERERGGWGWREREREKKTECGSPFFLDR